MTTEGPATTRPGGARRIVKNLPLAAAIAATVAAAGAARAAPPQTPLITIPPAKLPPLPPRDAVAAVPPSQLPTLRELLSADLQVPPAPPTGSGVAMYGALVGSTASATAVVTALFAGLDRFDAAPVTRLLLADEDDQRAQALFTAAVHGAPVIGVASAALGDPGSDITVVYDAPAAFGASFARLRRALLPDGTVEIGISDNSVAEADAARAGYAEGNWDAAIATLAKGGDTAIDDQLARTLADHLTSDTGEQWRIVSPAARR